MIGRIVVVLLLFIGYSGNFGLTQENNPGCREKAQYIKNVIMFTKWPDEKKISFSEGDTIKIGIFEKEKLCNKLPEALAEKNINTEVSELKTVKDIDKYDVLYMGNSHAGKCNHFNAALGERPVLTIADNLDINCEGVIMCFYVENNELNIRINQKAADSSGLTFKYQLYQQAEIVNPTNE